MPTMGNNPSNALASIAVGALGMDLTRLRGELFIGKLILNNRNYLRSGSETLPARARWKIRANSIPGLFVGQQTQRRKARRVARYSHYGPSMRTHVCGFSSRKIFSGKKRLRQSDASLRTGVRKRHQARREAKWEKEVWGGKRESNPQ